MTFSAPGVTELWVMTCEACQSCRLPIVSSDSTQTFFPSGWSSQIIAQEKNIITFQKTRDSSWKYSMNKTITGNKWGLPMMHVGFPYGSVVKNLPANAGDVGLIPGSGRSLGEYMATHSSILPGKSHGERSLVGYSPWGCKRLNMNEWLSMHACHSTDVFQVPALCWRQRPGRPWLWLGMSARLSGEPGHSH